MHEFSPEEARRWDAWQRGSARSARRTDRIVQVVRLLVFAAVLVALSVAAWLR